MNRLRLGVAAAAMLALTTAPAAQPGRHLIKITGPTPTTQEIDVSNFRFAPQPIRLLDRPVTLKLVNRSGSGHDFTAPEFFARAEAYPDPKRRLPASIELRPHETKMITLVPHAGRYEFHCSHFLHKQMGMRGLIVVE